MTAQEQDARAERLQAKVDMVRSGFQPWATGTKHEDSKKAHKTLMVERRKARAIKQTVCGIADYSRS